MGEEKFTATDFPDKGTFLTPSERQKKPDCDRKTFIPDPCEIRIDRRSEAGKPLGCDEFSEVITCPRDLGTFKVPEPPEVPEFIPEPQPPIVLPPRNVPDTDPEIPNPSITLPCPGEDQDPDRVFGGEITISAGAFTAATLEEATALALAKLKELQEDVCKYGNPRLTIDCNDLQLEAAPIGGIGYQAETTSVVVSGDGTGAIVEPTIVNGRVTALTIVNGGSDYDSVAMEITGEGVGAAVGRVVIDDTDGSIISAELGQVLPDPAYNPETDPPIASEIGTIVVPEGTFLSLESQAAALIEAKQQALKALDCRYQSPTLQKLCPEETIPQPGFDLPQGLIQESILSTTQQAIKDEAIQLLDGLECVTVPCPNGLPEISVSINVWDPNPTDCDDKTPKGNVSSVVGVFDEATCTFDIHGGIPLPEILCPCGFETNTNIETNEGGIFIGGEDVTPEAPEFNLKFDPDNCEFSLDGKVPTPSFSVPCPDGPEVGLNVIFDGGVVAVGGETETAALHMDMARDDCNIDVRFNLSLPNVTVPCPEPEVGTRLGVAGGAVNGRPAEIDLRLVIEDCNTFLEGNINLPNVDIPCPDGLEFKDPKFLVTGGFLNVGSAAPQKPTANITATIEDCDIDVMITMDLPNTDIPCPEPDAWANVVFTGGYVNDEPPDLEVVLKQEDCNTILELNLDLPNVTVVCGEGLNGRTTRSSVAGATGVLEISTKMEGCNIIPEANLVLDIACPDGLTGSTTTRSVQGQTGQIKTTTAVDGCQILSAVELSLAPIPCPDGITALPIIPEENLDDDKENDEIVPSPINIVGGIVKKPNIPATPQPGEPPRPPDEYKPKNNVNVFFQDCMLGLKGEIELPNIELPCEIKITPEPVPVKGTITRPEDTEPQPIKSNVELEFDEPNCEIKLKGEIEVPDIVIPDVQCPEGLSPQGQLTVDGSVKIGEEEPEPVTSNVEMVIHENCEMEFGGQITIPPIEIPTIAYTAPIGCSNIAATTGGVVKQDGEEVGRLTSNLQVCINESPYVPGEFAMEFSGGFHLPDIEIPGIPDIPCKNGIEQSGNLEVTGGLVRYDGEVYGWVVSDVQVKLNSDGENCALELTGGIDFPNIDINIPDFAGGFCSDGINTSPGVPVVGGVVKYYEEEYGRAASDLQIRLNSETCNLELIGGLEFPNIQINIPCETGIDGRENTLAIKSNIFLGDSSTPEKVTNNLTIEFDNNNCKVGFGGEIAIPDIHVAYPEQITGSDKMCVSGGEFYLDGAFQGKANSEITVQINTDGDGPPQLEFLGCLELPSINVNSGEEAACDELFHDSLNLPISGGVVSKDGVELSRAKGGLKLGINTYPNGDCFFDWDGGLEFPNIELNTPVEFPDVACANGIQDSLNVPLIGGVVRHNGVVKGRPRSDLKLGINTLPDGNCVFDWDGNIELPNVDINVPESTNCTTFDTKVDSTVTDGWLGNFQTELELDLKFHPENCTFELTSDLTLPNINLNTINLGDLIIPCPDGFGVAADEDYPVPNVVLHDLQLDEQGKPIFEPTTDLRLVIEDDGCNIGLQGNIHLPNLSQLNPCPVLMEPTQGQPDITITDMQQVDGEWIYTASTDINLVAEDCELGLRGTINIPNVLQAINCVDGISFPEHTPEHPSPVIHQIDSSEEPSWNVQVVRDGCDYYLSGHINIPNVGTTTSGSSACPDGFIDGVLLGPGYPAGDYPVEVEIIPRPAEMAKNQWNVPYADLIIEWDEDGCKATPNGTIYLPEVACPGGIDIKNSYEHTGAFQLGKKDGTTEHKSVDITLALQMDDSLCELNLVGNIGFPEINIACSDGIDAEGRLTQEAIINVHGSETTWKVNVGLEQVGCKTRLTGELDLPDIVIPEIEDYNCRVDPPLAPAGSDVHDVTVHVIPPDGGSGGTSELRLIRDENECEIGVAGDLYVDLTGLDLSTYDCDDPCNIDGGIPNCFVNGGTTEFNSDIEFNGKGEFWDRGPDGEWVKIGAPTGTADLTIDYDTCSFGVSVDMALPDINTVCGVDGYTVATKLDTLVSGAGTAISYFTDPLGNTEPINVAYDVNPFPSDECELATTLSFGMPNIDCETPDCSAVAAKGYLCGGQGWAQYTVTIYNETTMQNETIKIWGVPVNPV